MEFRLLAVFIWAFCLNPIPALAQPPAPSSNHPALTKFLQSHYKPSFDDARPSQYAFVDLNGDGVKEAIVYLRGRTWCGTGGCPTLILARRGSSYRFVTKITITWPPIRVLTATSNGWHDIGAWVEGGGIRPGYEAELRFNGQDLPHQSLCSPCSATARESARRNRHCGIANGITGAIAKHFPVHGTYRA